jgi:CheY-like chemotaxis protein
MEGDPMDKSVLVVDSSEDNVSATCRLLDSMGFKAIGALTANQAIALASELQPCVVLMDTDLPGLSGFEACRSIRKFLDRKRSCIVGVTGRASEEAVRDEANAAGFDKLLLKPLSPSDFESFVRGCCAHVGSWNDLSPSLQVGKSSAGDAAVSDSSLATTARHF